MFSRCLRSAPSAPPPRAGALPRKAEVGGTPPHVEDDQPLIRGSAGTPRLVLDAWTRPMYDELAGARSTLKDATIELRFKRYGN